MRRKKEFWNDKALPLEEKMRSWAPTNDMDNNQVWKRTFSLKSKLKYF